MIFFLFFKKYPNITNYSVFNYSAYNFSFRLFRVFGLLSFFPLPCMVCLSVFVLKRLKTLSLKPPTPFLVWSGIQLNNQSYQVFLVGLVFKNSSSVSHSILNSLSFNCIKSFSNYKRLLFIFKNWFFCILFKYFLSTSSFL